MPRVRYLIVGVLGAVAFALSTLILLSIMPKPMRPVDFMMTGAISTMAALAVVFCGIMVIFKQGDVFFKRRKKQ